VTGAGQGLGEAIAKRLSAEGALVTVADMNAAGAGKVADAINATGGDAFAFTVNVTRAADVEQMVKETVAKRGCLDLLVSNAGILKSHDITEFPEADWRAVIDVNLTGYFCARGRPRR